MNQPLILIELGVLFFAGLVADRVGHRTRLPRVTLLIGAGIVTGRSGLNLFPPEAVAWFEFLSTVALIMVAFLLGGELAPGRRSCLGPRYGAEAARTRH